MLGLDAVSDGLHVVHPAAATGFAEQVSDGRFLTDRRRSLGAAEGRRIDQTLHVGGVFVTILDAVTPTTDAIAVDDRYVAHNYSPLPVVAVSADGAWITDIEGRRYLDRLAAYSAVNFGHRNPEITAAAHAQLDTGYWSAARFTPTGSGPFCQSLAELSGKDMVPLMNSGAEASKAASRSRESGAPT